MYLAYKNFIKIHPQLFNNAVDEENGKHTGTITLHYLLRRGK